MNSRIGQLPAFDVNWLAVLLVVAFVLTGAVPLARATAQSLDADLQPQSAISDWEYFEREVRPLLLENCASCHSQSFGKVMGGLNMDSRDGLVAGGDSGPAINLDSPKSSLLLEAIRRESLEMPPDKPLSQRQIEILDRWVKNGAVWPSLPPVGEQQGNWLAERAASHWAWQPVNRRITPPSMEMNATKHWIDEGPRGPIDCFIFDGLGQIGVEPSPPARPEELLRRLYFDLIGLPPSVQEQLEFQQDLVEYPHQCIERWADRLLASPQFGVQWGRHWLDLMRYSETLGHEFDFPIRNAWRYRDAVVDSFNDDVDYRQMIIDHLAGDQIDQPRIHPISGINQSLALTGWWWMGDSIHAPVDIKADWATRLENQVDVLSKSFLGMTIACARCHDHKFDALSMDDYYGLAGMARSLRRRYAITDPHDQIALHQRSLTLEMQSACEMAKERWQDVSLVTVEDWLDSELVRLRSLSKENLDQQLPLGSPLYPLRLLIPSGSDHEFAREFIAMREQSRAQSEEYARWQSESQRLADFSRGIPPGWTLEAIGSENWSNNCLGLDWFGGSLPLPARRNVFDSARVGRHQHLTLRSPTFGVTHRAVCLKMRGKSTQSSVVVSNYFMGEFHSLLFDDLRKPIDQPNDWGWVIHAGDLNKYLGHPAFLSLENEAGAWFELSEVWLADRPPPVTPDSWAFDLLNAQVATRESFREIVVHRLHRQLVECWEAESHHSNAAARAALAIEPERMLEPEFAQVLREQSRELQQLDQSSPLPVLLLAVEDGTPDAARVELRGNPHELGRSVARSCLTWLPNWKAPAEPSSGRWELSQSLVDSQHPLVARAMVNRVWHHLMGQGLVSSTDNLGVLGSRPTHPELLDWLADQFMQHDWSIKWLVRQIVCSQAYCRSSSKNGLQHEKDPDGRYGSHRPIRRLSAENLRDAILWTCDSLDQRVGGPSVPVYLTPQMTGRGRPQTSGPLDGDRRRSIYLETRRNFFNPFLLVFDSPLPSTTVGRRNQSNVPSQALSLLNDPLMMEMSQRWASSTESLEPQQRIDTMFQTAFSRSATQDELRKCMEFVQDSGPEGWTDLAHVVLNSKEFYYLQ